ncbi:recombinase family protein [Mesorhizobium sp. M0293]|uniref:recombinase family protein n=1 Tax=Mesorhizobium sp. M0293 TaxID=2956930 RepID=UPI003338DCB9
MSELELSLLRARSMEALKQKARRGELFFTVAVGYVKMSPDKIEMDPDLRVREAIGLVFTRFAEMQSIRQVFLSLRSDQIALPYINPRISGQQQVLWKHPVYTTVSNLLTNPVYAGAYAFGRTGSRTIIENGRKRSCAAVAKLAQIGQSCSLIITKAICPGQTLKGINS